MAATYNKFRQFVEDIGVKVHNLDTDTLKLMLVNSAPANTNEVKGDLTEISAGNGYSAGGMTLDNCTYSQTTGTASLVIDDEVLTASGGTIGPFRYVVLYNDTPSSPADPLIAWWDYGSSITLADGETFTTDFASTVFTLA